ncbi:MAG: hypothetical protein NC343_07735 [Muribaculum sp.]|nr:hypothetical protein [Muribaculaceae bacterium]MCM1081626.1 hypothetical protein [Muribaculum sp.]
MIRQQLFALFFVVCFANVYSQRFEVESMQSMFEPMTVETQRRDLNNEICALVKVQLPISGVGFEGNLVGDVQFKINEYWVYLTPGTKFLQVKCPGYYPLKIDFRTVGINGVESKMIYELVLVGVGTTPRAATPAVAQPTPERTTQIVNAQPEESTRSDTARYTYKFNPSPTAIELVEHPLGIYVNGDQSLLYQYTIENFKGPYHKISGPLGRLRASDFRELRKERCGHRD